MPVFDWLRSELNFKLDDNSEVLSYNGDSFNGIGASELVEKIKNDSRD